MAKTWHIEFLPNQELTKEALHILFEWSPDPFFAAELGLSWRSKNDHLLIRCENRLACHVGLARDTIQVDDRTIQVGGIGDVITVPEFRGRGLAQAAVHKALEIIWNDWDLVYAILFCQPALRPFYERISWKIIDAPVSVAQPGTRMRIPMLAMFASRRGEPWPSGRVELGGLPW